MVKIYKGAPRDLGQIMKIMENIDLEKRLFIKSTKKEVLNLICGSYVCYTRNDVVGFVLIDGRYIDTIVSLKKGCGEKMISNLPRGRYTVSIAEDNKESQKLFSKFRKRLILENYLCGEERGLYEIEI